MNVLIILIPIAFLISLIGLILLIWSINNGQYDDLKGASQRILLDDDKKV